MRGHPAHGYELNRRLHERGFHQPGPRVYRLLAELERTGVVRSEWAPSGEGGPERRTYRLTRKGLRQLHEAAETLHKRRETLQLFLSHYAQASEEPGKDERLRPAPAGEALLSA
ncbi:MAG: PadR family transcriptional regulator [Actinomycetota bacterium]|nr:PadR family transcriptional regulator [Actinomycetota bacterium]